MEFASTTVATCTNAVLTEDFQAVMEEASGQDLDRFFRQWLLEPGYPALEISHEWDEAGKQIVLTVEQVQDAAWPTFRFQTEVEIDPDGWVLKDIRGP